MRLHELMHALPIAAIPHEDPDITGVSHDSRRIRDGDLFVAIPGEHFDGRAFAPQAAGRGAVAVLGRGAPPPDIEVPWISADDPRLLLGPIAARVYDEPHRRLQLVGITGTNGKSTVAALLAAVIDAADRPCATVGTLGARFAGRDYDGGGHTTPEASDLFRILDRMHRAGARAAVMEVSSHALALGRVEGAAFDLAVFTNLSRDHLDFHGDLESYFGAKRRLFDRLKTSGRSVVHVADEWGRRLADELPSAVCCGPGAEVEVADAELAIDGLRARFRTPRGELLLSAALVGRFNLDNLLITVAAAEALCLPHTATIAALAAHAPLAGRLEPVDAGQAFPVFVDYAHTPGALAAALTSLAEISERRIVLVFGCGGDRDRGKRAEMGRIAGEHAALPILTSDNPRGEEPAAIAAEVERGLAASGNSAYRIELDRRAAIGEAITLALEAPSDRLVLVAGKGHEEIQIIGAERRPFSDRDELRAALEACRG